MKETNIEKEKNIRVRLTETDCERLSLLCGKISLTVGELIEAFIGDLTGGKYTNGSDERMLADEWLQRCGFSMFAKETLLKYFIDNYYDTDDFLYLMDEIKGIEEELKEYEINPEKTNKEEAENANADLAALRECYDEKYKEIIEEYEKEHPDADIEEEIQAMMGWQKERMDLKREDAGEKRANEEKMTAKRISVFKIDKKSRDFIGDFYDEKLLEDFLKYQEDKGAVLIKEGHDIFIKEKNTEKSLSDITKKTEINGNEEIPDVDYPVITGRKGR